MRYPTIHTLMFLLGVGITVGGYLFTPGGGRYYILWGAIAWGAWGMLTHGVLTESGHDRQAREAWQARINAQRHALAEQEVARLLAEQGQAVPEQQA